MTTDQGVLTSTIGVRWLRKMGVFAVVLLGFGSWALYDAVWKYPDRGRRHAEWAEWQYLSVLEEESRAGRDPGILTRNAPVLDPVAELERLNANPSANTSGSAFARREWLTALSRVGDLTPENTGFSQMGPRQRKDALDTIWQTASQPSPLKPYDIPSQWLMMVIGYGLGAWVVFLVAKVAITKYQWEPGTKTLILPRGARIAPTDLKEVDKRKWDKFIVYLVIKPEGDRVGGQSLRFDTYRHGLVEEWILEMEREAFGSEEDGGEAASKTEASASTSNESDASETPTSQAADTDSDR